MAALSTTARSLCSKCHLYCPDYSKQLCPSLSKPPYVCNGRPDKHKCTLEKRLYSASAAQREYELVRSESRSGICLSEAEALKLDEFFSPLLKKGQSIHHICVSNPSEVMFSEKTIYNYVDSGIFSAKNIDLPERFPLSPGNLPCFIGGTMAVNFPILFPSRWMRRRSKGPGSFIVILPLPIRKAAAENNHEFIRRILPKGSSFDELEQEDVDLMMNHINSYRRANLGNRNPYEMFRFFYGQEILDALGAILIAPNDIILRPELLK